MALREVALPIRFSGGVETKQDDKGVATTQLLRCENRIFTKAVSLAKRQGYASLGKDVLGAATQLPTGRKLITRDNELLVLTDDELYGYLPTSGKWDQVADIVTVDADTSRVVAKSTSDQTTPDGAELDGVAVYAWEDSQGGVYMSVLDSETNHTIVAPRQLSADGQRPRVRAVGDVIHVYYVDLSAANRIYVLVVNPNAPDVAASASASILLETLNSTDPNYDVAPVDDKAAIAWNHSTATTVGVGYVHQSGVLMAGSQTTTATCDVGPAVAVHTTGDKNVFVAWWDSSVGIKGTAYTADLGTGGGAGDIAAQTLPDVINLTICFDQGVNDDGERVVHFFWESDATADQNHYVKHCTLAYTFEGTASSVTTWRGLGLASRAFVVDDRVYVNVVHDSTLYSTYYTLRDDGLVAARMLPGIAYGLTPKPHLPDVWRDGSLYSWAATYVIDLESENDDVFTEAGIRRVRLDFASTDVGESAQLGKTAYISGSFTQAYDGNTVAEADFHYGVDDVAAPTPSAGSGSLTSSVTYLYRFTLETTLANGEIIRGPASAGTEVVMGASDNEVAIDIPTLRLTAHDNVRIGVWRSEGNDSAELYRVSSLDPSATGANRYVANDTTVDTVSFTDRMSDADLVKKEPLYTNGGILNNVPITTGGIIATGKNRVFVNDPIDPLVVRYSQERAEDYAVEFSARGRMVLDPYGGAVTGLIVMDESVVVFKEHAIFAFSGPGPNAAGGDGWSAPTLITSDVGCTNARSIGYTPVGVVFQSAKGIHLLARNGQVSYIGAPVERYNSQTIVSASLVQDTTQIRFLTDSGTTLLYDYYFDQWSEWTNHEGKDAAIVGGTYHYLRNSGEVYKADTSYSDGNSQIRTRMDTAWIRFQDYQQGFQRIWRAKFLGKYISPHKLRIRYALDYDENWSPPIEFDPSLALNPGTLIDDTTYGAGTYGDGPYGGEKDKQRYQFEIYVGSRCEAIRFRIEDVEDYGVAGAAFELSELLIIGGVQGRSYPVASWRSK